MRHCTHCGTNVKTKRKTCPLCFKYLEEKTDKNQTPLQNYPNKSAKPKMSIITRTALFFSVIACIISIVVNIVTFEGNEPYYWSVVVLMGIPYIWLVVRYVILGHGLLTNRIASVTITTSLLVLLVEFCVCLVNGTNRIIWSFNYVFPATLILGLLLIHAVATFKKDLYSDSVLTMLYMALLGVIPYILYLTPSDLVTIEWTSLGCAVISLSSIIAMFVFNYRETCNELKKIFHV